VECWGEEPAFKDRLHALFNGCGNDRPEGYFYAAQDADTSPTESEPEEGAFYVWSYSELERLHPAELAELQNISP